MDKYYNIGNHRFRVTGDHLIAAMERIPGFAPFEETPQQDVEFIVEEWMDDTKKIPSLQQILYKYSFDNVVSEFGTTAEGYIHEQSPADQPPIRMWIRNGENRVYLHGNFESYLTSYAVGMGYELMTVDKDTVLVHSSCIVYNGKAILFLGKSGTGKSTHSRLWRENIPQCHTLNDDCPIVRIENGQAWVYGNPWSGKESYYRQERYPLTGFVRLSQAPYNKMSKLAKVLQLYAALHPSFFSPFANDKRLYENISSMIERLISTIPIYHLECLPDKEAALLSFHTFFPDEIL